jgi:hypothetical protein
VDVSTYQPTPETVSLLQPPTMNTAAFRSPRLPSNPRKRFDAKSLENSPPALGLTYYGQTFLNPAGRFADDWESSRLFKTVNQPFKIEWP